MTPEVSPIEKKRPKRSAKPKSEQPQNQLDATIQGHPAPESAPKSNGTPAPPYEWDRTIEEKRQKELARLENERLARLPLPAPKAKTLPWPDFCEYWNSLRELPVAPCVRLYVQRWLPVLLPVVASDRFGMARESHPSDLKILSTDGPLSEDLILQLGGVGDYTFRLNDTRRPWDQGTLCQSQLETKRLWDTYPPVFDLKRLDYDDKKNQVYIKFARARGILPREDDMEKEQADMAQATVVETVMQDARQERARADQLQREALERAEREARELKEAEAKRQTAKPVEPPRPASDLEAMGGVIVSLVNAVKPNPDNSLSEYLKLEAKREETRRETEKAEREAARTAAAAERARADKLQDEMLIDLKKKAEPAPVVAQTPPPTRRQMLEDAVAEQTLLKQLAGRGGQQQEEAEKPSSVDKWLEAAPILGPIVQGVISGIFQTVHFGLQTWQQISYNSALAKNGAEPKPPTLMQTAPEPGKPIPPQGPQPTPEQQSQHARLMMMLASLEAAAEPLSNAIDDGDSGVTFAEMVIKFKRRPAYDMIRGLGEKAPGVYDFETFKNNLGALLQHPNRGAQTAKLWEKVAPLSTFGQFLKDFFDYDEITAQQEEEK